MKKKTERTNTSKFYIKSIFLIEKEDKMETNTERLIDALLNRYEDEAGTIEEEFFEEEFFEATGHGRINIDYERIHKSILDITEPKNSYVVYFLGMMVFHHDPRLPENRRDEIVNLLKKYADGANGRIHFLLGVFYRIGRIFEKSYENAFYHYKKSFKISRYPTACANLGYMYDFGLGCEKNDRKAYKCYFEGAKKNHPFCLNNLGTMYLDGQFVKKNISKALKFFILAYEEGHLSSSSIYTRTINSMHRTSLEVDYISQIRNNIVQEKRIKELERRNSELKEKNIKLKYMPDGPGFYKCKANFEELSNT